MKPGKGGNATGPPRLGRAIIGATLLLKGDAFAPGDSQQHYDPDKPGATRGDRTRIVLPETGFGPEPAATVPAEPTGDTREAALATPAAAALSLDARPQDQPRIAPERRAAGIGSERPRRPASPDKPRLSSRDQLRAAPDAGPGLPVDGPVEQEMPEPAAQVPETTETMPSAAITIAAPAPSLPAPGASDPPPEAAAGGPPPQTFALPEPTFGATADSKGVPEKARAGSTANPPAVPTDASDPSEAVAEAAPQQAGVLPQPAFGGAPQAAVGQGAAEPVREDDTSTSAAPPTRPVLSLVSPPAPSPAAAPGVATAASAPLQSVNPMAPQAVPHALPPPPALPVAVNDNVPQQASNLPQPAFGKPVAPAHGEGAGSALPRPVFGSSAAPSQTRQESPHQGRPSRLAIAELPAAANGDSAMPRPAFGPPAAAEPAAPVPAELAASRTTTAVPLSGGHTGPAAVAALPAAQPRARLADTSPRMPGDPAPAFTIDDELILQVQTPRGELADTITAYGTRSAVYLPLGAMTRFLDLAISVSDAGHYASGWFLDEKQTMSINLRLGTLTVNGRELSLFRSDAAAFEGELYLRADRYSDLFPLVLTVDLSAQTVTVKTLVPFPFEARMARDEERARLAGAAGREARRWPREETPWRALSFPMADAELRGVSDSTYGTRAEGDLRIAGDFAFMTARAFASASSRDGLTGARIELGRRDPDGGLLGPLGATEFQLGDVTTTALPLGLSGVSGGARSSPMRRWSAPRCSTPSICAANCPKATKSSFTATMC